MLVVYKVGLSNVATHLSGVLTEPLVGLATSVDVAGHGHSESSAGEGANDGTAEEGGCREAGSNRRKRCRGHGEHRQRENEERESRCRAVATVATWWATEVDETNHAGENAAWLIGTRVLRSS